MSSATSTVIAMRTHADDESFRRIADALPQIVWVANTSGAAEYFNQLWYDYTGLDEAATFGPNRWKLCYHPDDIAALSASWERSLATNAPYDVEFRIRNPQGVYRWFLCRGAPMRDSHGRIERWIGTLTDIHDKKLMEQHLHEQNEFSRNVLAHSMDCIKIIDKNGLLQLMNENGQHMMEVHDFELCRDKPWTGFWQGEHQERANLALLGAMNGKDTHFEGMCKTLAGTPKWWDVQLAPMLNDANAVESVLIVSREITKQREREMEFRHILDVMPQKVWIARADGHCDYFNKRWYDFTGTNPGDTDGQNWDHVFHVDDRARTWERWQHSLATGEPYEIEYRLRRHDGEYRWMLGRGLPMRDEQGKILRWFGTCTDIHDKMEASLKLQQAREQAEAASMAKTEFLANMSHEIRTPMNAVVGLANILSTTTLTQKQREYISTLQVSAEQLLQLINDLLDLSRIESNGIHLEAIPFKLDQVIEEVVSINSVNARAKNIALASRGQCKTPLIGDSLRLKQIIMNLVGNAVKFTEEGSVNINVFTSPRVGTHMLDVMIAVEDTGIGIPADKVDEIFGKFSQAEASTTRRFGGSGLGLSIAKTLVELMGGQITVNSRPGKGSCFTLTLALPTVDTEKTETISKMPKVTPQKAAAPVASSKVLLVEDYHANVLVATMLLQNYGYSYALASSGEEALKKLEEEEFGAVLMDVQMPQMNGYQATAIIRDRETAKGLRRMPIIGMTAHALKGDRERCIDAGMDDYIAKPFRPETLKGVLEKYCAPASAD